MALSGKQILTTLFKDKLSVGNTRINREFFEESLKSSFVVKPQNLWMYGDLIPAEGATQEDLSSIRNLNDENPIYTYQKDESTIVPLIKKYTNYSLTPIDNGTDNAFKLVEIVDGKEQIITNVIPFNFYKNVYNYTLTTSTGQVIPFGVGDWIFDTYSSILTFNGELPPNVDHNHCPKLTFYRYIGGCGFRNDMHGYEAALVPLSDINIPANTFTFERGFENNSLQLDIINQANKVEENFVNNYGWDGSDSNEGIATSLEVLTPLLYSSSKDRVKGYDDSKDSQIYCLLTKAFATPVSTEENMPTISYISNKVLEGPHNITVSAHEDLSIYIRLDDGPEKLYAPNSEILLYGTDRGFIVINTLDNITVSESGVAKTYTFNVAYDLSKTQYGRTLAGLFYYSIAEGSLVPFHTLENNVYDISFPVVTTIGKIPPSVKLNALTLDALEDTITPDYYGPRIYNAVIAQDQTEQIKSADYVVKNSKGFYVEDIFNKIKTHNTKGTLYFRAGEYVIFDPDLTNGDGNLPAELFDFNGNIVIKGEDKKLTTFKNINNTGCTIRITSENATLLQNITFDDSIVISIETNGPVTLDNIRAKTVYINRPSLHSLIISHSNIDNLRITGEESITSNYMISESSISSMTIESKGGIITNNIIYSASITSDSKISGCTFGQVSFSGPSTVVGCTISTLQGKDEETLFRDCYIQNFTESITDTNGIPRTTTFPVYNGAGFLKYAGFANPIYYNETTNTLSIKYDNETIFLNEEGKLTVEITGAQVAIKNASTWERDSAYTAETPNLSETQRTETEQFLNSQSPNVSTIEDILKYIFKYKADLVNGKIPLQNLPDSVAYGGLHYCGLWSIETNHNFPSFEDIRDAALAANYDQEVGELQPGWFCIIDNSIVEENNPTKVQKLTARTEDNPKGLSANDRFLEEYLAEEYTAGDWIIFEGYETNNGNRILDEQGKPIPIWSKIDRSYQNPIFTRIPSLSPEGAKWLWDDGGLGALDFRDNTIYEAFYKVNQELFKLRVKQPPMLTGKKFEPVQDYKQITAVPIKASVSNNYAYIENREVTLYDLKDINTFEVVVPKGTAWNNYVYFGKRADFTGTITPPVGDTITREFTELPHSYVGHEHTIGEFTLEESSDPFKNELAGEGYWQGTKMHCTLSDIQPGEYLIYADEQILLPAVNLGRQSTDICKFNFTRSNHEIKAALDPTYTVLWNSSEISQYVRYASGIPYISTNVLYNGLKAAYRISFKISKAFYKYINPEHTIKYRTSFDEEDVWHSYEELVQNSNTTNIVKREAIDTDYFDLEVEQLCCPIPEDFIGQHQFKLFVRVYNIAGEVSEPIEVYSRPNKDLIGKFVESTRVCSGRKSSEPEETNNPAFSGTGSTTGEAGDAYQPNVSIADNIELMIENYKNEEDIICSHYTWPKGVYYQINDGSQSIDYDEASEEGQEMVDGTVMRYVTFAVNEITESNGFVLVINGENITMDPLTGINDNMSIQVLIAGEDNTWYDANKPMGYLEDPDHPNAPCLYAGKSTATEKRVSFGQRLLTGQIIVRIGISKTSNITIDNIVIKDIV